MSKVTKEEVQEKRRELESLEKDYRDSAAKELAEKLGVPGVVEVRAVAFVDGDEYFHVIALKDSQGCISQYYIIAQTPEFDHTNFPALEDTQPVLDPVLRDRISTMFKEDMSRLDGCFFEKEGND